MSWPFIRRRTHMRRFTELSQSYRESIREANARAAMTEARLQRWVDELAPRVATQRDFASGNLLITVEVERRLMQRARQDELLTLVAERIMRRLVQADRDYRGDLRQTEGQRLLGIPSAVSDLRASQRSSLSAQTKPETAGRGRMGEL